MTRRGLENQPGFGSDSFLDIVANIVGILIILIVVAGLRVSQAPVPTRPAAQRCQVEPATRSDHSTSHVRANTSRVRSTNAAPAVATTDGGASQPSRRHATASHRTEVPAEEAAPTAAADQTGPEPGGEQTESPEATAQVLPHEPAPPPDLVARAVQLRKDIEAFEDHLDEIGRVYRRTAEQVDQLRERLGKLRQELASARTDAAHAGRRLAAARFDLDEARRQLARLQQEWERLQKMPRPVHRIEHKVTPVSHEVHGQELHFRLSGERVSVVPLDELLQRLKSQIQRQRDWLIRFRRHEGQVGPVDGYTLTYVVERKPVPILEELQAGRRMIRIIVSRWELVPGPDVVEETAVRALDPGSRFSTALLLAPPDATLTFWVYPDSFSLFRRLQRAAQERGFTVAGRPLPFGVPIAGSPFGSRSAGQ
ncbi:MAG TPA: hypothetical protein EYP14_08690 [Planctomycetaceae bacterium]|nr:hypothetical protein [Planctomycetaceae bacterium]